MTDENNKITKSNCFSIVQIYFVPQKIKFSVNTTICINKNGYDLIQYTKDKFQIKDQKEYGISINSKDDTFKFAFPKTNTPVNYVKSLIFMPIEFDVEKDFAPYYISIYEKRQMEEEHYMKFQIPIVSFENQFLFYFPFSLSYPFRLHTLLKMVFDLFPGHTLEKDIALFDIYDNQVQPNQNKESFTQNISMNRLYIKYAISKKDLAAIEKRCKIANEIYQNEEKYVNYLTDFHLNRQIFEKINGIEQNLNNAFFNACLPLPQLHKKFLNDLQKWPCNYLMPIGFIYKDFPKYYKIYTDSLHFYKKLTKQLNNASNLPENKELIAQTQILSKIAKIFQVGFHYNNLFQALLDSTPKAHPDYDFIQKTHSDIRNSLRGIENKVNEDIHQPIFKKLQDLINVKDCLIEPNRKFISSYTVCHDNGKVILVLLSDLILFLRSLSNGTSLGMISSIPIDTISFRKFSKKSIFYNIYNGNPKFILFKESKDRDSFFEEFRFASLKNAQVKASTQIECKEVSDFKKSLKLQDHSIYIDNGSMWIFGGRNQENIAQNTIRKVRISTMKQKMHAPDPKKDISPRYKALMVAYQFNIYVFGGTSTGTNLLDDLWTFSYKRNSWSQLEPFGKVRPPPSLSYSMNYSAENNSLILVGGTDSFRIFLYPIQENIWREVTFSENSLISKTIIGHKSLLINKDTLLVTGGELEIKQNSSFSPNPSSMQLLTPNSSFTSFSSKVENYNNAILYIKLFNNGKLQEKVDIQAAKTFGFYPSRRSIPFEFFSTGSNIVLFGGVPNDDDENVIFSLSLKKMIWSVLKGSTKFLSLHGYACGYDQASKKIYVHGGSDQNNNINSSLFCIDIHEKESEIIHNEESYVFSPDKEILESTLYQEVNDGQWPDTPEIVNPLLDINY